VIADRGVKIPWRAEPNPQRLLQSEPGGLSLLKRVFFDDRSADRSDPRE
jgi:hypothetical protein